MFLLSLIQRRLGGGLESLDAAVAAETDPWRSSPERESRLRLIDEIISRNPGATLEFLDEFSTEDLTDYADHLRSTITPRGRLARWTPRRQLPGICCRVAGC
ncbi:MAG: hypothetical protein KF768_06095 [Phycisphaeraceae bacterium]|nr:hypothetical protein [Phycisphaeraceae bacterium]